ncbi:MAG: PEP-CTERM sorting domain-containing protein [Myxococcota bacterium]
MSSLVIFGWLLVTAAPASSASSVYTVTGGHVDIDVVLNSVSIGSANGVAITGVSVTADSAQTNLEGLELSITPNVPISLSESFGGFDQITVESATLTSAVGFTTLANSGVPTVYTANAGPLEVNGFYGASDSNGVATSVSNVPISYDVLAITGIVNTVPFLQINSVTINALDGTAFGEPGKHLTIVASYYVTAVPEPGTGMLAALGLVALGWRQRRSARKA